MRVEEFDILRRHMLAEISAGTLQLRDTLGKEALDERVMTALGKVPRHEFVPIELAPYAYANIPLPIGFDKTISQPFIVGLMTDLLDLGPDDVVLEIGTGLGYQAASRSSRSLGKRRNAGCGSKAAPTWSCASPTAAMAGPRTPPSTR